MPALWFTSALLPGGWADRVRLSVADGLIARVEAGVEPAPDDDRHGPAVPGLPNVHSHAFQRAMAGLAERRGEAADDNFWTWREAMYRFVDRLGPDEVEAVAALAYVEMLETGFTRVGEFHYLHHDPAGRPYADVAEMAGRIASAAAATGIGLTLLPCFYAHANFGGLAPTAGQRRFVSDLDGFSRLVDASRRAVGSLPGAVVGVAPHSLRAVTPDELREVVPLAAGGPVHIHVAEQTREVDDCRAWSGRRPVEWLLGDQTVDGRWCLIHATHTTDAERAGIASCGAVAGLCPITEANLGDGVFDARAFLDAEGRFGVGTDSNVLIDAAGELRQLEYAQRLTARRRNVLASADSPSTGRALFEAAYRGGSQALGVTAHGLAVGQPADLVTLDADHVASVRRGGDALLDGWVFAARSGAVDGVWVRGRRVVAGGRHVDREAIGQRFRAALAKCLA
ncbi:MAG: formimidoylglutamate deiminase [Gemmataceae bacterium]|nr:formimidoylglutamate deiminase [Gemmataceae bacterium]